MNFDKLNYHIRQVQLPEGGALNLPKGWEVKTLNEISENLDSKRVPITKSVRAEGSIPYYGASGIVDYVADYLFNESLLCISEDGANLLARTYPIAFSIAGKTWVNNHAHVLRFKNPTTQKFVEMYLNSIKLDDFISGMAQPKLNQKMLNKIPLPLPPLPEQQRIVFILDEAFAAIDKAKANAEQNLKNAKELFESYLQGVFDPSTRSGQGTGDGWVEKKLNEIGNAQTGTTPKTSEKENFGDFIPFIKPADVDFTGSGDIRYDNNGLSEVGLKKGRKMKIGSTLMVCIGATIGKVGFAEMDVSCNQQINSLTVKNDFEPKFIYYAMTSRNFQEKVLLEGKGAQATLPIINKSKWQNLTISFPKSRTEQKSFVEKFDALKVETQKMEAIYQKKIVDLEELKKSVLQKAFAGELKVSELGWVGLKDDKIKMNT